MNETTNRSIYAIVLLVVIALLGIAGTLHYSGIIDSFGNSDDPPGYVDIAAKQREQQEQYQQIVAGINRNYAEIGRARQEIAADREELRRIVGVLDEVIRDNREEQNRNTENKRIIGEILSILEKGKTNGKSP